MRKRMFLILIACLFYISLPTGIAQTVTTTGGTTSTVPLFTGNTTIGNSSITQSGNNVSVGELNTVINPAVCSASSSPSWCSGSDMGGWINAAIAALPNGCGTVRVPAGIFSSITTTIHRPRCVLIEGAGAGATELIWSVSSGVAAVDGDTLGMDTQQSGGWHHIWLKGNGGDGIFLGGDPNGSISPSNTLDLNSYNEDLELTGFSNAIRLGSNAWTWRCNGCNISYGVNAVTIESGISNSGENMAFVGSTISDNTGWVLKQNGSAAYAIGFRFIATSIDANGSNGTTTPIQGTAIFEASHLEQSSGQFFSTSSVGQIVDHGSTWVLGSSSGTDSCFGTLSTSGNVFSGSQFYANHPVSSLTCGSGSYSSIGVQVRGSASFSSPLSIGPIQGASQAIGSSGDVVVASPGTSSPALGGIYVVRFTQANNSAEMILAVGAQAFDSTEYSLNVLSNYSFNSWAGSGYQNIVNPRVVLDSNSRPQLVVTLQGVVAGNNPTLNVVKYADSGPDVTPDQLLPGTTVGTTSISHELGLQQDSQGNFSLNGSLTSTVSLGTGSNAIYRCTTAGTLPVGALTVNAANCGASTDTGLRSR